MPEASHEHVVGDLLGPDIASLLQQRDNAKAREGLMALLEPEIADVLLTLEAELRAIAFRLLPRDHQVEVFACFEPEDQLALIESLSNEHVAHILNEMDTDDRVDLIEDAPEDLVQSLMGLMRPDERQETEMLLEYPEESVGREMSPDFLTVQSDWTVQRAIEHIRTAGSDADSLNVLYFVDGDGRLQDHIRLRSLLLAGDRELCENLRVGKVISLQATDDREEAVRKMEKYDIPMLPVVDEGGVMVGIVTFDDVADVAEEEVTEDMQKMAAMEALDEPYLSASVLTLVSKRAFWLLVLFGGGMLTVFAMTHFDEAIEKIAILAMFVPLIIASGGNSGAQAATLMIRSLAIGELKLSDWAFVLRRELVSGLMLGTLLGLCGLFAGAAVAIFIFPDQAPDVGTGLGFGLAIGTAVVGVVLIGTVTGSMLPFVLQKLGFDPATSSTPFVATIVDVAGLIIYFVSAKLILGMLGIA